VGALHKKGGKSRSRRGASRGKLKVLSGRPEEREKRSAISIPRRKRRAVQGEDKAYTKGRKKSVSHPVRIFSEAKHPRGKWAVPSPRYNQRRGEQTIES